MPASARRFPSTPDRGEVASSYRVLMIAPTSFFADYGCHVRILEEAQVLQKLGHSVTISTYRNGGDVPGLDIRRTLPIPWRSGYEVGSSRHKIGFDALLAVRTLQILARERFDVIHAHLHEGALIGLILGKLLRKPVVFDFQGSMTAEMLDHGFLRSSFGGPYRLLRKLETYIDHSFPLILTSSAHAQNLLLNEFGCSPDHVLSLPDAVNAETFRPASTYPESELRALKASLGIPADRRVIVYLGLLAEYQGTSLLLEALRSILNHRDDVHLLLMGFPNVDLYRQKAAALGVEPFVTFTGRVPYQDAPRMLALGHVGVSAKMSLTEGAGKLLNYMAVALPCVTFDTPVAREYLGPDGRYARSGDPESLAAQLSACLCEPDGGPSDPQRLGQRLRQRAIQSFNWTKAGHKMVQAYEALLCSRAEAELAAR